MSGRTLSLLLLAPLTALVACSSTATDPPSAVSGTLTSSTFSASPDHVIATDEAGTVTSAAVAADGTFLLSLPSNHVYSLEVAIGPQREPFGFPRTDGRLDKNFRLGAGNAALDLGAVREVSPTPSSKLVQGVPTVVCDGTTVSPSCPNADAPVSCPTHGGRHGHGGGGDMSGGCPNMGSTPVIQTEVDLDPTAVVAIPAQNPPNDVTCGH